MSFVTTWLIWVCLGFLTLTLSYIIIALAYAKSGVNTFYIALPINRYAFVTKGGKVIRIIYNSATMKLVDPKAKNGYPMGKFVPISDKRAPLQVLGPVEKLLGIRYIGIPFVHSLLQKNMSWIAIEGGQFKPQENKPVSTFAITKTFGFNLKGLTLGSDNDKPGSGDKPKGDDQKLQRILVNVKLMLQAIMDDPHRAIIATSWMASVESKLMRRVQNTLGHTSQDELIEQKSVVGSTNCEIVQDIIDNIREIQTFGVKFEKENITYVDYELAGGEETIKRIQTANTARYEGEQEAAKTKAKKIAEQADAQEIQRLAIELDQKLKEAGYSNEERKDMVQNFMKTSAMVKTGLQTWVEAGSNTGTTVALGSKGSK